MKKTSETDYEKHLPTIAKGAGINFFGTISGLVLTLLFNLLIARVLTVEEVGLYFLGLTVVQLVLILSLLGLDAGIIRYASLLRGEKNEEGVKGTIFSSLLIGLPLSLLMAGGLFLLSGKIATSFFNKPDLAGVLKFFSLLIPFLVVASIFVASTQAFKLMQYRVYTKELVERLTKVALVLLFFLFGLRIFGAVLATVISSVIAAALSFYYASRFIPLFNKKAKAALNFKNLLSFSVPQVFTQFLLLGIISTDTLMLGYFLSAEEVGIYNIAAKTAFLGALVLTSFSQIFAPFISDLYNKKETLLLSNLFKVVTKWSFTFSLPLFLMMVFLAKPILSIFGKEFRVGALCLVVLSFSQIINSGSGPVGYMIIMSGRPVIEFVNSAIIFVSNIFLTYLLIPKYGIFGAAIATSISLSTVNIVRLVLVRVILKMHPYKLSYLKPLLAGFGSALLIFLGFEVLPVGYSFPILILYVSVFLLAYAGLLLVFGFEKEDFIAVEAIKKRLAPSKA